MELKLRFHRRSDRIGPAITASVATIVVYFSIDVASVDTRHPPQRQNVRGLDDVWRADFEPDKVFMLVDGISHRTTDVSHGAVGAAARPASIGRR
ncbi:hypothetical protein [Chitinimonas lacunae]|uniref:Uncharacterized protein n=1 Tax=Chitinimonas lacunae TaxID=1963018 RepID=A0ABV8MUV6_9NEIS